MATTNSEGSLIAKTFEHMWVIENWINVVLDAILRRTTTVEIKLEAKNVLYAKFLVGIAADEDDCVGFYWKLLWKHQCLENVQGNLVTEILKRGEVNQTIENTINAVVGTQMEIIKPFWNRTHSDSFYRVWTTSEGSLEIKFKFTLENLPDSFKTEEFRNMYRDEFSLNMATLLNDQLNSDVKLVTKDKTEFCAHKIILRARCPVFATMFGSDFLERSTGLVNVDDISAKTMKILLHYWYSGELLPSWKEADTIVEFTYSAGKYQMTNILQMLNEVIGWDLEASAFDVPLLKITHQLFLKNAEDRLLKRIVYKIGQAKRGAEILDLFNLTSGNLDEAGFSVPQILKACDDVMLEKSDENASCQDVRLMTLACKYGRKNVESQLVKRIVGTVVKMNSAEKLLALFNLELEN